MHSSPNRLAVSVTQLRSPKGRHMILDSRFWILDCGLKQHESHSRKRLRGERAERKGPSALWYLGNVNGPNVMPTDSSQQPASLMTPLPPHERKAL